MRAVNANMTGRGLLATLAICALALSALVSAAFVPAASASVRWKSEFFQAPTNLPPGGRGAIRILVENGGDSLSDGFPTVSFELPSGVTVGSPANSLFDGCPAAALPSPPAR